VKENLKMTLKELIERAEKAAGSQLVLSEIIGLSAGNIRTAKAGKRGLPTYACVLIAEMLHIDEMIVIAASELVTEKKEERRKIWLPFVGRVAGLILGAVTLNMTPATAEAAPACKPLNKQCILCKIKKQANSQIKNIRQTYLIEQH
jgi:hypothetical protein